MNNILVIEDNKGYSGLLEKKLSTEGFNVILAKDGEEALDLIKINNDINLILLDLIMPKMDGLTFYYNLKNKLKKHIPIIVLTNVSDATGYDPDLKDVLIKANVSIDDVVKKVKESLNINNG